MGRGISTSVSQRDSNYTLKVKDGPENDEYVITRHSQFSPPISIVNVYGEQESRTCRKDVEDRWYRIVSEVTNIEKQGEHVILIGDLNKHVGDTIKNNHTKVTFGGELIKEFLKSDKFLLLNSTSKVTGGPFTRYNPSDPKNDDLKSCIDLIIISKGLLRYVSGVTIDKDLNFTPGRPISKTKKVYSDHYAIIFELKILPLRNIRNFGWQKTWADKARFLYEIIVYS